MNLDEIQTRNSCAENEITNVEQKPKLKTLFVGDSISRNVYFNQLESATGTTFFHCKAYSSCLDKQCDALKKPPRFPMKNFQSVVPTELKKGSPPYYLIMQSPSVDITNLITTNPCNYEKLKELTLTSAKKFFDIGLQAIEDQPSLKKVVLLKLIPRYDDDLKSELSKVFNIKIEDLWRRCSLKTKLVIGTHTIECTGSIRESRYRKSNPPSMYDGVHLYGPFGRKSYTNSILHILESQNMTLKPKISEHKMVHEVICPSTNKAPFASTDIRLKVNKSTIKAIPEVVKHKDIIGNKISDSNLPCVDEVAKKFDNNFPNSDKNVCPPTVFRKKESKFNCASTNDIYSKRMKVFLKKYERPPPNLTITRTLQQEKKI